MGGLGALLITLSQLSPSLGVFVVGSDVIHVAGTAAFLCFLAAGLMGLFIANVYAELAAAFPETGGEYTIVGRVLGPAWGFAMLGLNLLTFSIAPAVTALGVTTYLQAVFPSLPAMPTAMALVALCMGVSILNIRVNAWVTGLFLAVELTSLTVVVALGFSHPARSVALAALHPMVLNGDVLQGISVAALGVGAAAAVFAFDGYGAAVYLGEEIHDAPRRMARVVFAALGLASLAMLAPVLAVQIGSPDLKALIADEAPIPGFIRALGGPVVARAMSLAVALALFNAMIATALMGGRHLYASGRDRAWPRRLNLAFSRLHPRFNSPWAASLAIGVTSVLWCLVKLDVLLVLIGDGTAAIYACMSLAALKGRKRAAAHSPYRMPLFPWPALMALACLAALALADLLDPDGRKGLIASAVVAFGAALYYRLVLRRRGDWGHRGPGSV